MMAATTRHIWRPYQTPSPQDAFPSVLQPSTPEGWPHLKATGSRRGPLFLRVFFDRFIAGYEWLADALCRLSTGGGYVTRALHTDREEIIFDASRPIILNGIPDLAGRPDLGDRAISMTLSPIADDQRLTEKKLLEEFGKKQPQILGALLDAVSGALRNYAEFKLERPPRQPDRRAPVLEPVSLECRK